MATSKILIDGVGIDLTGDTVTADKMLAGYTAHDSSGEQIVGTHTCDAPVTQEKTVSPSTSQQVVTPDSGKLLSKVTVGAIQTETKSAAPSESAQQITPTSGKFLTRVDVGAISSSYVGSGVTRKSAQTYTPGTANQMIAANQYLNGVQTIKGDANLIPANIADGVSIFGVEGTHQGSSVQTYTGTFSTNRDGESTVYCGFRPDVVVVDLGTYVVDGDTYRASLTFPICIDQTNWHEVCAWGDSLDVHMIDGIIGSTPTSFTLRLYEITENWNLKNYSNKGPFNVTAYKFL